jgi:hypothetical protein
VKTAGVKHVKRTLQALVSESGKTNVDYSLLSRSRCRNGHILINQCHIGRNSPFITYEWQFNWQLKRHACHPDVKQESRDIQNLKH